MDCCFPVSSFASSAHLGKLLYSHDRPVLTHDSSGCSTLLKTIAGETHGFQVSPESYLNYQGIPAKDMNTKFRGEAIYTAEVDAHFPQLSVGDTLYFAALARAPRQIPVGVSSTRYAEHLRDVSQSLASPNLYAHCRRSSWRCLALATRFPLK
jgi:ATP-binding cassette subfamily G (WHITE) protein 2 (PDR)